MTRTQRLFALLQQLRAHRYPVTAHTLAETLRVSVRTIYRDIATLQQQGAVIEGSSGTGYRLQSAFQLPPLMFDPHEVDALMLGLQWVSKHTDPELQHAARQAIVKIRAVLPPERVQQTVNPALLIACRDTATSLAYLAPLRYAIRTRRKVNIHYLDQAQRSTERTVWPVALGFFDSVRMLACWCERREAFRSLRLDRIQHCVVSDERYPRTRQQLLQTWRKHENIEPISDC